MMKKKLNLHVNDCYREFFLCFWKTNYKFLSIRPLLLYIIMIYMDQVKEKMEIVAPMNVMNYEILLNFSMKVVAFLRCAIKNFFKKRKKR